MSIIYDYQAEADAAFQKWFDEWHAKLLKLQSPAPAATAVTSTPQDEGVLSEPRTAGLGRPFEDVQ